MTVRKTGTAVKFSAALGLSDNNIAAAFRTGNADLADHFDDVFAVGISAAAIEGLALPAALYYYIFAALGAFYAC